MYLVLVSFLSLLLTNYALVDVGTITWMNGGQAMRSHIGTYNTGINVSGSAVSLHQQYQPRAYLMGDSINEFYRLPNLLNRALRFTVDIKSSACSCNAGLYLVDFPVGVNNNYYCDAQGFANTPCFELDLIEANVHAYQGTLHCGDGSVNCKNGCGVNYKSNSGFGIGGSSIDSQNSFQVSIAFMGSNSQLDQLDYKLTQSGKSGISFSINRQTCGWIANEIAAISSSITSGRLVLTYTYWSNQNMSWLDGCSTGQTCPGSSYVTFSDFQVSNSIDEENAVWTSVF